MSKKKLIAVLVQVSMVLGLQYGQRAELEISFMYTLYML